jgi:PAS domain S-box-containing protein
MMQDSPAQIGGTSIGETEDSFRSHADAIPHIVWTAGADGQIDYANARWHEVTHVPRERCNPDAWFSALHQEDRPKFAQSWQHAVESIGVFQLEFRLWSASHHEHRWHLGNAEALHDRAGKLVRWIGSCHDIHDLRTAEARLKAAIEESPVGLIILDSEGRPVFHNQRCAELRGHELELSDWARALHPADRNRVIESWSHAAKSRSPWAEVYRFMHADGRTVWVSGRALPIHSGSELLGFVRTLEDITELKTVEENLRDANQRLQMHADQLENEVQERTVEVREALAELDKLSYSIVHDMRAPLRAMQGFSNMLLQEHAEGLNGQGKRFLQKIASAAQRQDKLIQDVLTYHGYVRSDFPLTPVDLDALVRDIVETYAHLRPPKVHIEVRKPLGWVLAHETLLTQCVSALLDNAAKFVAPGVKPEIVIFAENTPTRKKLWIQDNGIGISPESRPKLFDIFYKFHHAEEYPGTGIGLPLAKKALEKMHGEIEVESEVGKGSRFCISLQKISNL